MDNDLDYLAIDSSDWLDEEEQVVSFAVHPGKIIKESILPSRRITAAALADIIGVARPGLNNMLNGKRDLTADMAILIGAAVDYPADALVVMMANHNLARSRAKQELMDRIAVMIETRIAHTEVANENHKVRKAV